MVRCLGAISISFLIAALCLGRVAAAQSVEDISAINGMSSQQANAALIAAHDREREAEATQATNTALLAEPMPQHLLPHQYAEMPFQAKTDFPELAIVQDILAQPEDAIDLAKVEIAVERLVDPSVNEYDTLHQLDALAVATRARFPKGDATDPELKGLILYSTMRDAGSWNGYRPFSYDLDHPLGENVYAKLLSRFLATRKGNCVSMPVMYVILAQKLGLPATLSSAPRHAFAKFRKDDGTWTNLEVTSYGGMTDQHYVERMLISETALANHIWLQTFTKKQSAILILETLVQYYEDSGQTEKGLALTDLLLKNDPKNITEMAYRGNLFCALSDQRYKKYGSGKNIPADKRADWEGLENNCHLNFAKSDELGWVEETPEQKARYLEMVKQTKASRGE